MKLRALDTALAAFGVPNKRPSSGVTLRLCNLQVGNLRDTLGPSSLVQSCTLSQAGPRDAGSQLHHHGHVSHRDYTERPTYTVVSVLFLPIENGMIHPPHCTPHSLARTYVQHSHPGFKLSMARLAPSQLLIEQLYQSSDMQLRTDRATKGTATRSWRSGWVWVIGVAGWQRVSEVLA